MKQAHPGRYVPRKQKDGVCGKCGAHKDHHVGKDQWCV
jgi:hypothetical protein